MSRAFRAGVTILLGVMALALVANPVGAGESITVVDNGGSVADAHREAFHKPFTAKYNVRVVEDVFAQELAKIRSQVETGNLVWDVASVTAINEATGCQEGLFERIEWAKILDAKDFEGVGGFGKCGVPESFVSGGLVYDGDKYKGENTPKSWADFWDVKKFPGKRGLLYRAEQTFEVALMADGVAPKDAMRVLAAPGGPERALKKLAELKPHIHWWKTGAESMQLLLTGEVVMTYGWNGRVSAANKSNKRNLRIEFGGGHVSGSQYLTVMKGAKKRDLAMKYIEFALGPEPQAQMSRLSSFAPTNVQAYKLMSKDDIATLPHGHLHLASYQSGDLYIKFWLENGDELLQRFIKFAAQ